MLFIRTPITGEAQVEEKDDEFSFDVLTWRAQVTSGSTWQLGT